MIRLVVTAIEERNRITASYSETRSVVTLRIDAPEGAHMPSGNTLVLTHIEVDADLLPARAAIGGAYALHQLSIATTAIKPASDAEIKTLLHRLMAPAHNSGDWYALADLLLTRGIRV